MFKRLIPLEGVIISGITSLVAAGELSTLEKDY